MTASPLKMHPIVRYRQRHKLSMADFATSVSTTKATISRIEAGRRNPGIKLIRRIMAATKGEVSADALLTFGGNPHDYAGGEFETW